MSHFFKINRFRPFLKDSSNERVGDATHIERRWKMTQASALDLLKIRAYGLYEDVRGELDCADQDDNEYCLILSNFAHDIDYFVCEAERLRQARGVRMP